MCGQKSGWWETGGSPCAFSSMGPWSWGRVPHGFPQGPTSRGVGAAVACCCGPRFAATKEDLEAVLQWLKQQKARVEREIDELEKRLRDVQDG